MQVSICGKAPLEPFSGGKTPQQGLAAAGTLLVWRKKAFFSEEKKQKTFASRSRSYPAAYTQGTKVFWFFFSKKNRFLSFFHKAIQHTKRTG